MDNLKLTLQVLLVAVVLGVVFGVMLGTSSLIMFLVMNISGVL